MRAFGRPKDAIRALTERRNRIEFMIGYTYKFKVLLVSWRLLYYIKYPDVQQQSFSRCNFYEKQHSSLMP